MEDCSPDVPEDDPEDEEEKCETFCKDSVCLVKCETEASGDGNGEGSGEGSGDTVEYPPGKIQDILNQPLSQYVRFLVVHVIQLITTTKRVFRFLSLNLCKLSITNLRGCSGLVR